MKISDTIESFIRELFEEEQSIELKRNELANYFNCVPSQINYVISTRFTTERGYIVESRRGGGGHIKITKIEMDRNDAIRQLLARIGPAIDVMTVESIANRLFISKIVSASEAKLIMTACSNNALSAIPGGYLKNQVRADIFKNLLLMFV